MRAGGGHSTSRSTLAAWLFLSVVDSISQSSPRAVWVRNSLVCAQISCSELSTTCRSGQETPPSWVQDIIQPHATVARTTVVHSRDPQLERSLRSRRTPQDTCVLGAFALTRVSWELLLCWLEDFVRHHVAQFSTRRARIGALIHDRACCPHAARSMARASSSRGTQDRAATWDICRSRLARIHRA